MCYLKGTFFFNSYCQKSWYNHAATWELLLCSSAKQCVFVFYCKAPISGTKSFFGSSRFYHIFLFVLNCEFQMLVCSCFTILNMFRKSSKNVRHYLSHMGFSYLYFHSIHLLILYGGVEQNPEPKDMKFFFVSLELYVTFMFFLFHLNAMEKFGFICLFEWYLQSWTKYLEQNREIQ